MKNKRGQQVVAMPFAMIFSIFLIAIFVVAAFVGSGFFLDFGKTADIGMFYDDLQDGVDDAWRGQSSSASFKINLPKAVKKICFANLSAIITNEGEDYDHIESFFVYEANTFLIPPGAGEGMEWKLIEHINISKITSVQNPYCVDVDDGLTIKKDFYDKLVWIE
jgi:hypothetical protein